MGNQTDGVGSDVFKKPSVAASVAVFGEADATFLVIVRRHPPFMGHVAFPGGYLDVDREDVEGTALRELAEETGVVVSRSDLRLLDVRSRPDRDPRGHVIDIGYLCVLDKSKVAPVLRPSEESEPKWMSLDALKEADFAFDHREMFNAATARLGLHSNRE